ncbi:transglycosylase SLT domain-containing protein [Mycobacterium sp. AZCC_0083]|uniref:aggregation-promoting factor C-terminal-like domain-containing protein n=1 Tax=Mycobacterium sp. AZCC_0083 TaxID=2735882 RepID=UPI00161F2741|nr:transglycosylase SLT domain-containing protein [Mycobacterium sp. AZCC_0083]MBB5167202.1 methyl-accepting chemotaxis protein [Mycobacterium sp. AZCC_0083]
MATLAGEAAIRIIPTLTGFKTSADRQLREMRFKPIEIGLDPNFAKADAEMDAWRARQRLNAVNVPVRADFQAFKRDLTQVEHIFKRNSLSQALRLQIKVVGLDALPALAYAAGSAASGLDALAEAGLALPGILGGALASVGALAIGMTGISATFKAFSTDQKDATKAAQDQQKANRDLSRSYSDYKSAVRDTIRSIQDLNSENRRSSLNVADAVLSVQEAADKLRQGGQRSITELKRDQIDYLEAIDHLQDVRVKAQRTSQDAADANAKGVAGSDSVVQALDRIADAQDKVNQKNLGADTFATQLAKLAPHAQSAINAVLSFKGAWKQLTTSVQNNLFDGIDKAVINLGQRSLPGLEIGLSRVASGLNANFKSIAESLGSDTNQTLVQRIFGDTSGGLQNFSRAMNPLVEGVARLTKESADFLPRIGAAAEKVFTRFDAWTEKISGNGALDKWIDNGLKAVDSIGNAAVNIGSIMTSIGEAFDKVSGHQGGFVKTLEDATGQLAALLNTQKGKTGLADYFQQAKVFIGQITNAVKQMAPFLGEVRDIARDWSGAFFEVAGSLLKAADFIQRNTGLLGTLLETYLTFKTVKPIIEGVTGAWSNYNKIVAAAASQNSPFRNVAGIQATADSLKRLKGEAVETRAAMADIGGGTVAGSVVGVSKRNDAQAAALRQVSEDANLARAESIYKGMANRQVADEKARQVAIAAQRAAIERQVQVVSPVPAPIQRAQNRSLLTARGVAGQVLPSADAAQQVRALMASAGLNPANYNQAPPRVVYKPQGLGETSLVQPQDKAEGERRVAQAWRGTDLAAAAEAAKKLAEETDALAEKTTAAADTVTKFDEAEKKATSSTGESTKALGDAETAMASSEKQAGKTATAVGNVGTKTAGTTTRARTFVSAFNEVGSSSDIVTGKLNTVAQTAEETGEKVNGSSVGSLGTRLKGLAGALAGPALLSVGLLAVTTLVEKLGEAHRNAARDAKAQDDALKNLATTLDSTTGGFTSQSLNDTLKQFKSATPIPGVDSNFIPADAMSRLGLNQRTTTITAAAPNQAAQFQKDQDARTQDLANQIEATDEYKNNKAKFDAYGITPLDLARAGAGYDAESKKVNDAISHPKTVSNGRGGAVPIVIPDLAKVANSLSPAGKDLFGVTQVLQNTHEQNAAQGALNLSVSQTAAGPRQLSPLAQQALGQYGIAPGSQTLTVGGEGQIQLNQNPGIAAEKALGDQYGITFSQPDPTGVVTVTIPPDITDQWLPRISGFYANGGLVGGIGGPTSDSNLAMVSRGEHIARAAAVQHYGVGLFDALNNQQIPREAIPGLAGGGWWPLSPPPVIPPTPAPAPAPGGLLPGLGTSTSPAPGPGLTGLLSGVAGGAPLPSAPVLGPPMPAAPPAPPAPPVAPPTAPATPTPPVAPAAPAGPTQSITDPGLTAPGVTLTGTPTENVPTYTPGTTPPVTPDIPTTPTPEVQVPNSPIYSVATNPFTGQSQLAMSGPTATRIQQFAQAVAGKVPYQWGGFSAEGMDCSGLAAALANIATGQDPFAGGRFATGNEGEALAQRGFIAGDGGPGTLTIGWNGEHTGITLPSGEHIDAQGTATGIVLGQGSQGATGFPNVMHLPLPDNGTLSALSASGGLGLSLPGGAGGGKKQSPQEYLAGLANNVGGSLSSIGLQFLDGITGINFSGIAGFGQGVANDIIGNGQFGGANSSDSTGIADQAISDNLNGVAGVSPELNGLLGAAGFGSDPNAGNGPEANGSDPKTVVHKAMLAAGFQESEWPALEKLVQGESSWDPTARNGNAFGLFQFKGHENDEFGAMGAYSQDPYSQAVAGMAYIKSRYGTPTAAYQHWLAQSPHSYATGGMGAAGPAWLSKGEYRTNAAATKYYGPGLFNALNSMSMPRFATGGWPGGGNGGNVNPRRMSIGHFAGGGWPLMPPPPVPAPGGGAPNGPMPIAPPAPPEPALGAPGQPGPNGALPGPAAPGLAPPGVGDQGSPSTGGALGPGATAPAPDPGATPQVSDALTAIGGLGQAIGGGGGAVGQGQPGADPSSQVDPRATLGAAPTSSDHTLPAISSGIQGAASTLGSIASTAASLAGNAFAPGAGSAAGAGIQAGFQIGGQVATGVANVISSLLVGTATGGSTSSASGVPLLPARQAQTPVAPVYQKVHNGDVNVTSFDDLKRTQDRLDSQQQMPYINKFG